MSLSTAFPGALLGLLQNKASVVPGVSINAPLLTSDRLGVGRRLGLGLGPIACPWSSVSHLCSSLLSFLLGEP